MSVIIRLQNLPWNANALDIRQFFYSLSIPDGGVHIIGGEKGDAFIAFSTDEDARRAMMNDGGKINELPIRLFLSSKAEMQNVIVSARGSSLPVAKEPFGRPPVQEALGGGRLFDGYEYAAQKNRGVPPPGNAFAPALGMGAEKRDGWSQNIGQGNAGLQFPVRGEFHPMGGTSTAKPVPDLGLRPQLDKPGFDQTRPAFDTPAVGGGQIGESGIQGRFGSEWGALPVGREAGNFLRDGRGSGLGEFGNSMQQQLMERGGFARGDLNSRMYEETPADNGRWLGNQDGQVGFGKADLGREFGRTEDDFGRGLQNLPERPGIGRPELGRDFTRKDPGLEYGNVDGRREFGRQDLARENLARDMNAIPAEERLRRFIDAQGLGQNQSGARDLGRPFTADASRVPPIGSRDLRLPGSDFGSRDRETFRPDAFPRPDPGPGFPLSEFSQSTLGREFDRGALGLDAARLSARVDTLIRGARDDVRAFGSDNPRGFPPRSGFGRGEQGPGNDQPPFGADSRRLPFDSNFRGENPASRLLVPPRDFLNTPRDFLDRLSEAGPGLRGRFDERGFDEGSRKDRISSGSGGGVWIRAINFPLSYNYKEIRRFFEGCEIPSNSLKLVNNRSGGRTGLVYIRFNNVQTAVNSLKLSGRMVDGCRVTVESCGEAEYENAVDNFRPSFPRDSSRGGRSRSRSPVRRRVSPDREVKVCVVVKTLSSKTTEADVRAFFSKSRVAKNGGPFLEIDFDGRPTGCALVQFDSVQDFDEAVLTNRRLRSLNGVHVKVIGIKKGEFEDRSKKARTSVAEKDVPPVKPAASSSIGGGTKEPVKLEPRDVEVASSSAAQSTTASAAEKEKPEKTTAESSEGKPCCVEVRGVPWTTTVATIKDFFKGLSIVENGIHVMLDREGRAAGSVFVEFASTADCMKGLEKNRQYIGKRYVNIVLVGKKQMLAAVGNQKTSSITDAGKNSGGPPSGKPVAKSDPGKETLVSLKNLNFQTQLEDILEFFQGYHPIVDSIKLQYKDGKPTGDGLAAFPDAEEAQGVIRVLNRKPLLGRPILLSLWK